VGDRVWLGVEPVCAERRGLLQPCCLPLALKPLLTAGLTQGLPCTLRCCTSQQAVPCVVKAVGDSPLRLSPRAEGQEVLVPIPRCEGAVAVVAGPWGRCAPCSSRLPRDLAPACIACGCVLANAA
jgi:hypothetical protein